MKRRVLRKFWICYYDTSISKEYYARKHGPVQIYFNGSLQWQQDKALLSGANIGIDATILSNGAINFPPNKGWKLTITHRGEYVETRI